MTRGNLKEARAFYERAYTSKGWGRGECRTPGVLRERFSKMWYRAFLEYLAPCLELSGKRVLEVGCGTGFLAPHLHQLGAEYVGTDIALTPLREVARPPGARCSAAVADGRLLPFKARSFDVVLCMEVLEHVRDPHTLVSECFRVIRPAGRLVFSCPNYCNGYILLRLLAQAGVPWFRRHMHHQVIDRITTAFSLRRLLRGYGRVVIQRGVRLHPPFFEQLDYRLSPGNPLIRVNDLLFAIERRWGDRSPWNYLGAHTIVLVSAPG